MSLSEKKFLNIRLISSPESVERIEPSWLAISETVVAVIFYWTMAYYLNTHILLLISFGIAPLLLLRSRESTKLGLIWFRGYFSYKMDFDYNIKDIKYLLVFIALFLVLFLSTYQLIHSTQISTWLPHHERLPLFLYSFLLGLLASGICILALKSALMLVSIKDMKMQNAILIGMVFGAGIGVIISARKMFIGGHEDVLSGYMISGALLGVITGWIATVEVIPIQKAARAMSISISLVSIYLLIVSTYHSEFLKNPAKVVPTIIENSSNNVFPLFLVVMIMTGIPLGIWLRSIVTRIFATICYLRIGLRLMPANWKRNLLAIDSHRYPEMMPGTNKAHAFSYESVLKQAPSNNLLFLIGFWIVIALLFVPATLYRWGLKSTIWIYWPLIYLYIKPTLTRTDTQNDPRIFVTDLAKGQMEKIREILALVTLIASLYFIFNQHLLPKSVQNYPHILLMIEFLIFNLMAMASWHWLAIIARLITIRIYFLARKAYSDWQILLLTNTDAVPFPEHTAEMHRWVQVRNLITLCSWILYVCFVLLVWFKITPEEISTWRGFEFLNFFYAEHLNNILKLP
ncbi:MAG: hypothetical protein HQL95_02360 [Magnetococcales bacterium]|nr:hypothetical protein [Magnetococcales bacterium]